MATFIEPGPNLLIDGRPMRGVMTTVRDRRFGPEHVSFDVDEPLPLGPVEVTILATSQVFDGQVTTREIGRNFNGDLVGSSHIEATGAPRPARIV